MRDKWKLMNVPEELWGVTFDRVPQSAKFPVQRYFTHTRALVKRGVGLYLHGDEGVGKSAIGALVGMQVFSTGFTVLFIRVWDLREAVRTKTMYREEVYYMDRCMSVDFLVLDDLKAEDANELYVNDFMLEGLIKHRSSWRRPTFITSRLGVEDLGNSLPGVYSTLVDGIVPVAVRGENQRDLRFERVADFMLEEA